MTSKHFQRLASPIILLTVAQLTLAQQAISSVTHQCSLIRELVTAGREQHFATIRNNEIGSTRGYQTDGRWEFKTTRYDAMLHWPGANRNYLENYTDNTDTSNATTWQYIAEFTHVPNAAAAKDIYTFLNRQIEGCRFPLDDSTAIDFEPLPENMLPPDRPAILETASLYNLPVLGLDKNSTIHVMTGMEKRGYEYNVALIIENVVRKPLAKVSKR